MVFESQVSALACLDTSTHAGKPPQYPPDALERRDPAVVRVRVTFASADAAPQAKVFYNSGQDTFAQEVLRYVQAY